MHPPCRSSSSRGAPEAGTRPLTASHFLGAQSAASGLGICSSAPPGEDTVHVQLSGMTTAAALRGGSTRGEHTAPYLLVMSGVWHRSVHLQLITFDLVELVAGVGVLPGADHGSPDVGLLVEVPPSHFPWKEQSRGCGTGHTRPQCSAHGPGV